MEQKLAYYWCTYLQMISPLKVRRILEIKGGPQELFGCTDGELRSYGLTRRELEIFHEALLKEGQLEEDMEKLDDQGIRFVTENEEEYPGRLKEVTDHPVGLFVKGCLPKGGKPCVAIVGARGCSSYGRECAEYFAQVLAGAGVQIISGMAYGIDSCSQRAALQSGTSFAVLGGGVNICYPRENIDLYEQLIQKGGVLSEMRPDTRGLPVLFPRRNRIISGISEAVVVVEARKKSGSLITAEFAGEQGRYVYAVPGPVHSRLSEGCHQLIRNGGILLSSPEELMDDLHIGRKQGEKRGYIVGKESLSDIEGDVYQFVEKDPVSVEQLLERTGYPAGSLSGALLCLELKGYICQEPLNCYRRTRVIPPGTACRHQKK